VGGYVTQSSGNQNGANEHWYMTSWGVGLIGALASIVAALIGLAAVRVDQSSKNSLESSYPERTMAPTTAPTGSQATDTNTTQAAPETTAGAPQTSAVLWHSKLHMPYQSGLDLDLDRPRVQSDPDRLVDITTASWADGKAGFSLEDGGRAGRLTSSKPSFAGCVDALDINALDGAGFTMRLGNVFCVETSEDQGLHRAAVRVLSWDEESLEADIEVIVWVDTSPR
jgi:hypothetical protein